MLADLRALRREIDQALASLERLAPAVAAWRSDRGPNPGDAPPGGDVEPAAQDLVAAEPEPAEAASSDDRNTATAESLQEENGSQTVVEAIQPVSPDPQTKIPVESHEVRLRICRGCSAQFEPEQPQQRFCSKACRRRTLAERRREARQRAAEAPGCAPRRRAAKVPPETSAAAAAVAWPERQASGNGQSANGGPRCAVCGAAVDEDGAVCSDRCAKIQDQLMPPRADPADADARDD